MKPKQLVIRNSKALALFTFLGLVSACSSNKSASGTHDEHLFVDYSYKTGELTLRNHLNEEIEGNALYSNNVFTFRVSGLPNNDFTLETEIEASYSAIERSKESKSEGSTSENQEQNQQAVNSEDVKALSEMLNSKDLDISRKQKKATLDHINFKMNQSKFELGNYLVTEPVDVKGDYMQISFTLSEGEETRRKSDKPFELRVRDGWAVDASFGFVVMGNQPEIFSIRNVTDSTRAIVRQEFKKGVFIPEAVVMLNAYPRCYKKAKWSGFSFGIGTAGDNVSYHLGSGVMIGEYNRRLMLTAGVSLFKQSYIDEGLDYMEFDDYKKGIDDPSSDFINHSAVFNEADAPTNYTKETFRPGFHAAITYNLNPFGQNK